MMQFFKRKLIYFFIFQHSIEKKNILFFAKIGIDNKKRDTTFIMAIRNWWFEYLIVTSFKFPNFGIKVSSKLLSFICTFVNKAPEHLEIKIFSAEFTIVSMFEGGLRSTKRCPWVLNDYTYRLPPTPPMIMVRPPTVIEPCT